MSGAKYDYIPGQISSNALKKPRKISAIFAATSLANSPLWRGVLKWDSFRRCICAVNPPVPLEAENGKGLTEIDVATVRMWFQNQVVDPSFFDTKHAIGALAKQNEFHPLRDYLESVATVSTEILDDLAEKIFRIDPLGQPLANTFLKKWLVAAAARIVTPGCKVDTMLVLMGEQGKKKSTFFDVLGGDYYKDQLPDIGTRDGSHALQGFWIIEVAECQKFLRTDKEIVKEYLSRRVDKYREYGNADRLEVPRQCVFAGTTNQRTILRDETGDRRTWPVEIVDVDLDFVRKNRDAIWGAAYTLAKTHFQHWLTDAEEAQANTIREAYQDEGQWTDAIRDYLRAHPKDWVLSASSVYKAIFGAEPPSKREQNDVGATLRRLGCKDAYRTIQGARRKVFGIPHALQSRPKVSQLSEDT